jgi:hypothetical protein
MTMPRSFKLVARPMVKELQMMFRLLSAFSLSIMLASCCCAGGSDSDNNQDTDFVLDRPHYQGTGNDT